MRYFFLFLLCFHTNVYGCVFHVTWFSTPVSVGVLVFTCVDQRDDANLDKLIPWNWIHLERSVKIGVRV